MAQHYLVTITVAFCCLSFVDFTNAVPLFNLTEDSHNVNQCPDPTTIADSPLCELDIKEGAHFLGTITKTVTCPETGVNKYKIACVIVKDNVEDNNGGYASISDGGLNQYYVDIELKSQWNKGIDFHIEVYTVSTATTSATSTTAASSTTVGSKTK